MPTLSKIPSGCAFNPRCTEKKEICETAIPEPKITDAGTMVACHMI